MRLDRVLTVLTWGAGGFGTQDHQRDMYVPAFQRHAGFTLVKSALPDLGDAIRETGAEVVSVCAPPAERGARVIEALRAGCHVLADKPLALDAADVEEIAATADEMGLVCMPAHHHRFGASIQSAKGALAAGRIGLPWNVQADFLVDGGDPCPEGELVNFGLYPVDVVRALTGQAVRRVHALPGRDRNRLTVLLLDHEHGLTSTITVGRLPGTADAPGMALHRYRISGSGGVMDVDAAKPGASVRTVAGNRTAWHGPGTVDRMLTALHTAIVTGSPPEVGPGDALAALRVTDAAARSLALGTPVPIDSPEV
ncbi:putative dehydrogenase [Actinomadura hallensis]|uniref:Putative dehydrogenase n=1 Tax=Actinomadura hallensis TaxID=337895 RepID=A0A543I7S8_9ACTN|nr:Gfo/Idh/MocA family oxidoreductase [Actinomadura hallensis]TQM66609.1 putative dehydrogenase [Actinomadura hallensis]HLV73756.1 Gfo/Idh/MocA family oxidoreductase [Vulgatibacteraceae bacterium]